MIAPILALLSGLASSLSDGGLSCAGVAMAESENRLLANPALLGSDSLDRSFHMRLSASSRIPLQSIKTMYPHVSMVMDGNTNEILSDEEFLDDLWKLDGSPVSVHSAAGLSFWQGDWGFSSSLRTHPGIRLDHGILIPTVEVWDSTDTHLRFAVSQPFGSWRVGTGIHVRGQTGSVMKSSLRDPARLADEVRDIQDSVKEHMKNGWDFASGLDLGLLFAATRDVQLGMKLGDLGMTDREGDLERPLLDIGAAWIPTKFRNSGSTGARWTRRLSVGTQWRDALDTDLPLLGHLDFGVQTRHNLTARGIEFRTTTGLRGGWPTGGFGFTLGPVLLDAGVWVEDLDPVLGRTPLQNWDVQLQLGW